MNNEDKEKQKKLEELMKQVQEEQMKLHPEIYKVPKKEVDD